MRQQRFGFAAQAAVAGLIIGLMMQMRWGYSSGEGDQYVLTPLGLHWANPDNFANDWALTTAPQPHWFFDGITWLAAKTDTLGGVFFLYWLVCLAFFGCATAILARAWVPRHTWLAVTSFPILAGIAPLWFLGNGSSLFPVSVPSVLGGAMIYLMVAALLTERHRLAAITGMILSIIHVQQAVLGVALMGAAALTVLLRTRRIDRWLVSASVVALAGIYLGLKLRPVAGHTKDFAEACVALVPYHCDANHWKATLIVGSSAMLFGFTSLVFLFLRRDLWLRAFLMLGLPAAALAVGVVLDRFDVPVLGELSQGLYLNRLAVILFPFGFWGVLAPFFANVKGRAAVVATGLLAVFTGLALLEDGWGVQFFELLLSRRKVILAAVLGVLYLAGAYFAYRWVRQRRFEARPTLLVSVLVVVVILFGFQMGMENPRTAFNDHIRSFSTSFVPVEGEREWGRKVERLVPPGDQILIPIQSEEVRLITRRAVVVDCKYGPYGGKPWQEYKERINSLGGFEECRNEKVNSRSFSAAYMTEQAKRWGANFMVVDETGFWRIDDLVRQQKWTVLLEPEMPNATQQMSRHYRYYLLKAPWA